MRIRLVAPILLLASGCLPTLSTLQRMETAVPGDPAFAFGAGASYAFDPSGENRPVFGPALDIGMRQGLGPNLDVGGRLWPLGFSGTLDLKYRFLHGPIDAAIIPGLGVTFPFSMKGVPIGSSHPFQVQAYGVLLLGYGHEGRRLLVAPKLNAFMRAESFTLLPGAMIGFDIGLGDNGNLVPEVNFHCSTGMESCFVVASIGMFY